MQAETQRARRAGGGGEVNGTPFVERTSILEHRNTSRLERGFALTSLKGRPHGNGVARILVFKHTSRCQHLHVRPTSKRWVAQCILQRTKAWAQAQTPVLAPTQMTPAHTHTDARLNRLGVTPRLRKAPNRKYRHRHTHKGQGQTHRARTQA